MEDCCQICYGDFGKWDDKKVECQFCETECCVKCLKKHILTLPGNPSCPACNHFWNTEFCEDNLTKKFMNGAYKNSRMELLFSVEENKLKDTMNDVKNMIESETYTQKINDEKNEIQKLQALLTEKKKRLSKMRETQQNLKKPNYIRFRALKLKCPISTCRGFLKSDYTCILCENKFCDKCLEQIDVSSSDGESKHQNHVCNPDTVATVQMIQKQSKPCPGCSELISKINGCDQMWCIKCHIAFDWNTGKIDYGRVHNPHFIEWQKQRGVEMTRQPGEILCGGLPNSDVIELLKNSAIFTTNQGEIQNWKSFHKIQRYPKLPHNDGVEINFPIFKNVENQERFFNWFLNARQYIESFRLWELDHYRRLATEEDFTRELRIDFIRKIITEEKFKKDVYKLTKKKEKIMEILHIFELCYVVSVEQYNEIYRTIIKIDNDPCNLYKNDLYNSAVETYGKKQAYANYKNYRINMWLKYNPRIVQCIENIENIIQYCNQNLYEIALKYKTSTPFISSDFKLMNYTIKYRDNDWDYLHKKKSMQKILRTRYDGENLQDWYRIRNDVVPIKELFDIEQFKRPVKIRKDGTWYFKRERKSNQNNEIVNNVVHQNGGIVV